MGVTSSDSQSTDNYISTASSKSRPTDNYISTAQVARDFQLLQLPRDLTPGQIPGIGPNGIKNLKEHNIQSVNELVGHFFLLDRDEEEFAKFLQQIGVGSQFARDCAATLKTKLGGL